MAKSRINSECNWAQKTPLTLMQAALSTIIALIIIPSVGTGQSSHLMNYICKRIVSRQPLPNENSNVCPNYYLCCAQKTISSGLCDAQTTHAHIYCK